jgi:sec-independent protein translocase protein TatA
MGSIGATEVIILLAVVLLLFGAKRLPDAARGLGRSLRIFKSEIKAAQDDDGNSPPQQIKATNEEVVDTTPVETPRPETTER